jgi:hypothetical protein
VDIEWRITDRDIARVRELLAAQDDSPLVHVRRRKNLADTKPPVDREAFWTQMTSARLTSVQRSGPRSHVARFIRTTPFPLAYGKLRGRNELESLISHALRESRGIRFSERISRDLAGNFRRLEGGEWEEALKQCNRLTSPVPRSIEQEAANYIRTFNGFGPKQSRNLLQGLGLTRYEIPIDSRITDWLNKLGFPVRLSAEALADPNYYEFVSDGIQALCVGCDVYPCVLDAAIFGSYDIAGWTESDVIA